MAGVKDILESVLVDLIKVERKVDDDMKEKAR
jgi:hypothetical protein